MVAIVVARPKKKQRGRVRKLGSMCGKKEENSVFERIWRKVMRQSPQMHHSGYGPTNVIKTVTRLGCDWRQASLMQAFALFVTVFV